MVPMDITSITVDCDITQMLDARKGVHCMVPKSIFVKK
jgi:acetamidase/formamidase